MAGVTLETQNGPRERPVFFSQRWGRWLQVELDVQLAQLPLRDGRRRLRH